MKDVKHLERQSYTRPRKRQSQTELHQSVLTDHIARRRRIIDKHPSGQPLPCWRWQGGEKDECKKIVINNINRNMCHLFVHEIKIVETAMLPQC